MTTRDIRAQLRQTHDVEVSAGLISRVTDAVVEELADGRARPPDRVYPVIFIDAIMVKIRVLSLIMWVSGPGGRVSEQVRGWRGRTSGV